ncbi:MAG: cellulose biosynthesis protein BcsG [Burkholderiales bacterium]
MGYWSFYFLAKLGLYAAQLIGLNWWANLVFAMALAWPLIHPRARFWRHVAAVPVAIGLLWHDSNWPGASRLLSQWSAVSEFSGQYLVELAGRVISWQVVVALVLGAGLYSLVMRRLRLGVVAVAVLAAVPLLPHPGSVGLPEGLAPTMGSPAPVPGSAAAAPAVAAYDPLTPPQLDKLLLQFYDTEQARSVVLEPRAARTPPFDIVVLSVCSLAWDDLAASGLDASRFFARFDLLFRQFNSVASYSGPAVLRLLHAGCGQPRQHALYEPTEANCMVFQRLEQAGYRSSLLLNHDGHFDHFAEQLAQLGGLGLRPTDPSGAPVAMHSFDGSPIYSDIDLLSRWWQRDSAAKADGRPRALLYNTISLHDGNRLPGSASTSSLQTWKPRAARLMADFERFFAMVERSGRPTVVVFVPEHGAGLRGDALQISGMREYPTPRITHVPVGLALLGFGPRPAEALQIRVDQTASYSALFAALAVLLQRDERSPWETLAAFAQALPPLEWVAENERTLILRHDSRTYLRTDGDWQQYGSAR